MSKSVLVLQFTSVGEGLHELNKVSGETDVLEFVHLSGMSHAILQGPTDQLTAFKKTLSFKEAELVTDIDQKVLNAYYNIENNLLVNHALVCESEFLGDIFKVCDLLVKKGFQIVELRQPKALNSKSYLVATTSYQKLLQMTVEELKDSDLDIRSVENLSEKTRNLFNP